MDKDKYESLTGLKGSYSEKEKVFKLLFQEPILKFPWTTRRLTHLWD